MRKLYQDSYPGGGLKPQQGSPSPRWWPRFSVILTLFLLMGCATLSNWFTQTHYQTFELTIDEQKVVVNLPNELPSMDKAVNAGDQCFKTKVCRQRFCVTEDLGHDHVDFVYIKTEIIALVWIKSKEIDTEKRFLAWAYVGGKPLSVPISRIRDLIKEHSPNQ